MCASFFLVGLLIGGCLGYFGAWNEYKFDLDIKKSIAHADGYCKAIMDMAEGKEQVVQSLDAQKNKLNMYRVK